MTAKPTHERGVSLRSFLLLLLLCSDLDSISREVFFWSLIEWRVWTFFPHFLEHIAGVCTHNPSVLFRPGEDQIIAPSGGSNKPEMCRQRLRNCGSQNNGLESLPEHCAAVWPRETGG